MADRLISIENVNAGSGKDIVKGSRTANILNGEGGNDASTDVLAMTNSLAVVVKTAFMAVQVMTSSMADLERIA